MDANALLTPLESYKEYKEIHAQNVTNYFESLVNKGKVDIEANKKTIADIEEKKQEIASLEKQIRRKKTGRIWLIIGLVVFALTAIYLWQLYVDGGFGIAIPIVATVVVAGLYVLFIYLLRKLKKAILGIDEERMKKKEELDELISLSWSQMAGLNALYDWSMAAKLVNKTIPLLELDDNFNTKRYEVLHEKYGLSDCTAANESTAFVQSGSILGNPFVFSTANIQEWGTKTYTGSLVIHWTERYTDSQGHTHTRTRTQTLYATVTKPAPIYFKDCKLIYGNEAAPNLSFSRDKSNVLGKSEKEIEKIVSKGAKKLEKKADDAVKHMTSYTKLGNDEFEVLFGGDDRDNEMEFRLMFTPLAQQNMVKLIKSQEPYGDDFAFKKYKKINLIRSDHAQRFSYRCNPQLFISNSYEYAKNAFETYCNNYFKSMYFDFAPLLSVPIYQQYKARDYIYKNDSETNVTKFEHEAIANSFRDELLEPDGAKTPLILKTNFNGKYDKADHVTINAYAFDTIDHVDYVAKLGGDGHMHNVPVHWDEYFQISKQTNMEIKNENTTRSEFNDHTHDSDFQDYLASASLGNAFIYERGLLAALVDDDASPAALGKFSSCLSSIDNQKLDDNLSEFDDSELKAKMENSDIIKKSIDIAEQIDKSEKK